MANRRDWSALSADYRSRLERKGITRTQYESGVSLKAARGHKYTPEHPEEAIKNPQKYKRYRASAKSLQQQVTERKERVFGGVHKWHEGRSREYVYSGGDGIRPPGVDIMRQFLKMTDAEIEAKASEAGYGLDDDWRFLFYH